MDTPNETKAAVEDAEILPAPVPWWTDLFNERQRQTIQFANIYVEHYFDVGTPGHNQLLLISKMSEMLNRISQKTGINVPELYYPEADNAKASEQIN